MRPYRVIVAHNEYQLRGGEDVVVDEEVLLLRRHGHSVYEYKRHNDEVDALSRGRLALQTLWSERTVADITAAIASFRPDVLHVHNTLPLLSPSIYWAAWRSRVPVVQTLHNFRLICPQAMLLREGKVCEDCVGRLPWRGTTRRCYRGSLSQSAVLSASIAWHRGVGTWTDKISRYIALNEFCRAKFIEGGLPTAKVVVKPNFVDLPPPAQPTSRHGFLFVGRLSAEKGIATLASAILSRPGLHMRVAGGGPELPRLERQTNVELLGALSPDAVYAQMRSAEALVMPSIWYENFPRTLVEAYACGLPVIASRIGALADLVVEGKTGLLFAPGDPEDLAAKLDWAAANPVHMRTMGINAREKYEAEMTGSANERMLAGIYAAAIADRQSVR